MEQDIIITIEQRGAVHRYTRDALPLRVGASFDDDIRLSGVQSAASINALEGIFFIQPERGAGNVRLDGRLLTSPARIGHGSVIALDHMRLKCSVAHGQLHVDVDSVTTGGDTAPPDFAEVARRAASRDAGIEIVPIAFRKSAEADHSKRRIEPASVVLAGTFLVLGVLGWFAFTAKSVHVAVTPIPSSFALPDTLFKLRLGDRYLLRPGVHRVTAGLAGYQPLDAVIEVGDPADQSFAFALDKLPGLVTITTSDGTVAAVSIEGRPLGTTPLRDVELPPGTQRLLLEADRHLPAVSEIDVTGGGERQSIEVALVPSYAPVTVRSRPAGAEIFVDGSARGVTPTVLELDAGERAIELRLTGHNAWRDTVQVVANRPLELDPVELEVADGKVELVTTPAAASVSVNGQFRGQTPLTLVLPPDRQHEITLAKPGYESVRQALSVAADSGRRIALELVPQFGVVEVASTPAGAEVWVAGEVKGRTPLRLELMAVQQEFELRLEGHAAASATLTPRPGFPQRLERRLEPLDAVTGGGYAPVLRTSLGQELKLITPGAFTMGSSRREQGRRSNEMLRPVRLSRAYYLGLHEVTNAEFRAFKPEHDSGRFGGLSLNEDDQPVVSVSWSDVVQYLNWLSIRDRLQPVYEERQGQWVVVRPLRNGYRLPTEAEWAWAARFAGQPEGGTVFPWGNDLPPPDRSGNYADLSAGEILPTTLVTYNDGFAVSAPPGRFDMNLAGIFDLGGNVAEWVQDFYAIEVDAPREPVIDPLGPETGQLHVIRGASWRSASLTELRLAYRAYGDAARDDLGFRLARNLE